ncbi:MAG TPA: cupredoxin domain-containing protein [Anaerolineales bacterium]|nr:cupredoxin domain-containing protein [Anaerolineales bacterium]
MRRGMAVVLPALGLILGACAGPPVQELSLTAADFSFTPNTLEVTAGVPVRLTMMNEGTLEHDFSILEMPMETMAATSVPMEGHDMTAMGEQAQLHMAAAVGMSNTIEFTPTKPGTYEFFCTVPGHKEAGMVGTMTVHSR